MDQNTCFNFGTRKIQKVKYLYLTPLPVHWVKSMKLLKGDSLRIEMLDDYSLKITPVPSDSWQDCGTRGLTPSKPEKRCQHGNYDIRR